MRRIFVPFMLLILNAVPQPALGITGAASDGGVHPYVGALIGHPAGGGLDIACSGFLIAPQVFLTAGHCTWGIAAGESELPFVTFADPVVLDESSPTLIPVSGLVTHPGFNPRSLENDLGVALLESAPASITPVGLPYEGQLGSMRAAGSLSSFVMVSYGAVVDCSSKPCTFPIDGSRHVASAPLVSMIRDFVFVRNGVCSKDSGSPQLLPPETPGSPIAGALTNSAFGCAKMGGAVRLDTSSALGFLEDYV